MSECDRLGVVAGERPVLGGAARTPALSGKRFSISVSRGIGNHLSTSRANQSNRGQQGSKVLLSRCSTNTKWFVSDLKPGHSQYYPSKYKVFLSKKQLLNEPKTLQLFCYEFADISLVKPTCTYMYCTRAVACHLDSHWSKLYMQNSTNQIALFLLYSTNHKLYGIKRAVSTGYKFMYFQPYSAILLIR